MKTYTSRQYELRKSQNFLLSFGPLDAVDQPLANTLPPDLENFRLEPHRQSVAETIDETLFVESLEIDIDFVAIGSTIINVVWRVLFVGVLAGRHFKWRESIFSMGAVGGSKCQHKLLNKIILIALVKLQPRIYPILLPDAANAGIPGDDCNVLESITEQDIGMNEA